MIEPADVMDFWFGAPDLPEFGSVRDLWFKKSEQTDAAIRARFGDAVEAALAGELDDWERTTSGRVACILLLDQFTRNIFRGTARSFAGDEKAVASAERFITLGFDQGLPLVQRWFVYLPFEHSESMADQHLSVNLFERLARDGLPEALEWAQKHADVIRRFGRFPHRNEILGRKSTLEELEFLKQPGSRF